MLVVCELKIVTIGAWGHLGRVLSELDRSPGLRMAGMAKVTEDDDPESYRQKHACLSAAPVFDDHRRMLREIRPQVVIISTRIDQIAPLAIEAATQGCHLICEKPLAIEHESLRKLWDTCRAKNVQCIAILNNHVHPVILAARKAVDEGLLGTIALVSARKSYKWGNRPRWFGQREIYGGTIPWVGIHALDFITSVTSQSFVSVAAMHSNVAHLDYPGCEDNVALALRLSGGGHASISLDLLRPAAAETHGDDRVRVVGDRGALEANLTKNRCTLTTSNSKTELALPRPGPVFWPFLESLSELPTTAPCADMLRAFQLNHASLVARDAADRRVVLDIEPGDWS